MGSIGKRIVSLGFCIMLFAIKAAAQNTYPWPASGNVGIGTTTPGYPLSVSNSGSVKLALTGSTNQNGILFDAAGSADQYYVGSGNNLMVPGDRGFTVFDVTKSATKFYVDSLGRVSIPNGNVGIGTTSPYSTLHVNANGWAASGYGLMLGQTGNGGDMSVPVNAETSRFEIAFPTYRDVEPNQIGAKIAAIRWNNYGANNPLVQAIDLAFFTSTGSDGGNTPNLVDTSSEKMRITAAGNVGIGTSSPNATLTTYTGNAGLGMVIAKNYAGGGDNTATAEIFGTDAGIGNTGLYITQKGTGGFGGPNSFVWEALSNGSPVMLQAFNGNVGIGTIAPVRKLHIAGDVQIDGSIYFGTNQTAQSSPYAGLACQGGDYAESVDVAGTRSNYEPGDVLVISAEAGSDVTKSFEPYSTSAVGIYSTKPGYVGRRQTTDQKASQTEVPMAMIGIVPTKVSAENGPIHRGDLMVTSFTPGYAMRGTDRSRMLGAVIGKALGSLDSGTGVIEVVVTLQ